MAQSPQGRWRASNEVMEDNSKRHAKIMELAAMVPQKQKEMSHVSPQKTPGEIHRDQRAEEFDKQGKQSICSTPISSSTRTPTMQSTLASIEKQAQQAELSAINREKNWGGTRSDIRKIVATCKRTTRKPSLVLYIIPKYYSRINRQKPAIRHGNKIEARACLCYRTQFCNPYHIHLYCCIRMPDIRRAL